MTDKIKAKDLLKLLESKHYKDVFVPECKNGPSSLMTEYFKLDAWVLKKQCRNPLVIGYEIKVDRSDFINDKKWLSYLNYCNEFYFVCPPHLIEPNELPPEAGLYWCSKNCVRLYNKKISVYREDISIPEDMYRYILMWRADIRDSDENRWDVNSTEEDSKKYWTEWLLEKDEKKIIGGHVSKKLQELVKTRIEKVESENERVLSEIKMYAEIKKWLEENDIHLSSWTTGVCRNIKEKLDEIKSGFSKDFRYDLNKCLDSIKTLKKHIDINKDVFEE